MILALGAAAASGAMLVRASRATRARTAARAGFLNTCLPLLEGGSIRVTPSGLPRLSGRFRGHVIDVQTVSDSLSYRKLPTLWLIVTMPGPMPLRAVTDLMLRPRGTETFSNYMALPDQVEMPAGLPEDGVIRTDDPAHPVPAPLISAVLRRLGSDRVKEIILSPKGLRIVWLAEEADRGRYLLYRDAEMGVTPLAPDVLSAILDAMVAMREAVETQAVGTGAT